MLRELQMSGSFSVLFSLEPLAAALITHPFQTQLYMVCPHLTDEIREH